MRLFKLLTILTLFFIQAHSIELKTDKDSILALGIEMSTMRNMLKSYILIGAKTIYDDDEKPILKQGIIEYEDLLYALHIKYTQYRRIQISIKTSISAWKHVRNAMELALKNETPAKMKEGALFIHANIRTVIREMESMKQFLLQQSNIKYRNALNATIEIAASARRLSAHYMMSLWHLNDPTIVKHWNKGISIYSNSLKILQYSTFTQDPRFNQLFTQSSESLKYLIKMYKKPKIYYTLVNRSAEKAFVDAEKMTQMILNYKQ